MQETFLQRQQRLTNANDARAGFAQSPAYPNDPARGRGFIPPGDDPTQAPRPKTNGTTYNGPRPQAAQPTYQAGPTAAGGANQPSPSYYTLDQYQNSLQQRYGRRATDQELQGVLSQGVGAAGPQGYTAAQWNTAQRNAENYARSQGWNGPAYQPVAEAGGQGAAPQPGEVGHQGRIAIDPGDPITANTEDVNPMTLALMQRILANPESLDANTVAQMKARSKEGALAMADQLRGAAGNDVAGRGFSGKGGVQAAANREIDSELLNSIINSNRETDINAATQNFADRLNAVGAADSLMNNAETRAGMADARRLSDAGFRFDQMNADRGANLQEFLGRSGVNLDRDRLNETSRQFNQTYGLDLQRFLESIRQFDASLGENARQANNNLGFNYTQLGQQGQQGLMNWLSSIYGNR